VNDRHLDNLYLVDSSLFPSIRAVNPSRAMIAIVLRGGDHLHVGLG